MKMKKSDIVALAAKQGGYSLIDLRLSQNDIGDIKGMPSHIKGKTVSPPRKIKMKKSDIVALAAKQGGYSLIDLRLSQNDIGDLKGMPFIIETTSNKENKNEKSGY
jgi:hypothetical protein